MLYVCLWLRLVEAGLLRGMLGASGLDVGKNSYQFGLVRKALEHSYFSLTTLTSPPTASFLPVLNAILPVHGHLEQRLSLWRAEGGHQLTLPPLNSQPPKLSEPPKQDLRELLQGGKARGGESN